MRPERAAVSWVRAALLVGLVSGCSCGSVTTSDAGDRDGGPVLRDAALACGDDVHLTIVAPDTQPNHVWGTRAGEGVLVAWNGLGGDPDWHAGWITSTDPPMLTPLDLPIGIAEPALLLDVAGSPSIIGWDGEEPGVVHWSSSGLDVPSLTWQPVRSADVALPPGARFGAVRACLGDPGHAVGMVQFDDATFGLAHLHWTGGVVTSTTATSMPELGRVVPGPAGSLAPTVLGCATVHETTYALVRAVDGSAALLSRWSSDGRVAEGAEPLGPFESHAGTVAIDPEGPLFLVFDASATPTLHAFRPSDSTVTEIGAREMGSFGRTVDDEAVLGSVPVGSSTVLLFQSGSFLQAVEVAPTGAMAPPVILTDVACRTRSGPVELGRGFVLPAGCGVRGLGLIGVCTG